MQGQQRLEGADAQNTNVRRGPIKDEITIGQLITLLNDGKQTPVQNQQNKTYVVQPGDTLISIALSLFSDSRFGLLLYIINKTILPGYSETEWQQVTLRAGIELFLPSEEEARCFRLSISGSAGQADPALLSSSTNDQLPPVILDQEIVQRLAQRRNNIERLLGSLGNVANSKSGSGSESARFVARFGDTLRSIALKHPTLNDVSLWRLLAQCNGLSTAVDAKGVPVSMLTRGTSLRLPTPEEITIYRAEQAVFTRANSPRKALQAEVLNESSAPRGA